MSERSIEYGIDEKEEKTARKRVRRLHWEFFIEHNMNKAKAEYA